ncbi:hypothetical protein IQ268_05885 [Oculatella sp. LEGE 06141]|nr:hypothetical protein [Oculatella sp. LEGE 06141]MBE9178116.1 hypothetical protein [Oculatella sp. LEGE 06141]
MVYQCLCCQFRRDLSDSSQGDNSGWLLIIILAIATLLVVAFEESQTPPLTPPQLSPQSTQSPTQF